MPAPKPAGPAIPGTTTELSEFLLRACHDLRGPVRTIHAYAELMERRRAAGQEIEVEQSLGFVLAGVSQAEGLMDGLTDYSLALDIRPSSFLPVPMEVMLRTVLAKMAARIRECDAEIVYGKLPVVTGNPDRLMQLYEYLLDFGIRQRSATRPKVAISAETHEEGWQFQVRHNGAALEADLLERIFTPFERLQGNQRPGPGLAVCRVIVERHRGRIWAESDGREGITFCFTLPE